MTATITRFAPSPTGLLHLGHAYAALFAHEAAKKGGGRFILRLEDIDPDRCGPKFEQAIYEDLSWLGLDWDKPVRRQSDHMADYRRALDRLWRNGLLYPCFCTRKDIEREIKASGSAPHGPDGPIYPGICRRLNASEVAARIAGGKTCALRLNMRKAVRVAGDLQWTDLDKGEVRATPEIFGDVVLARKDAPTSYHLAVTVDDTIQGVSLVTRGLDLFPATHVHRLLQALLGIATPRYRHHGLLADADGKRLAKRDKSSTIRSLRERGYDADDVRRMALGHAVGL